jgi:hypothetical protein
MSTVMDVAERAVTAAVARISGPIAGGVAVFFYVGVGLVLPLALHRSVSGLVQLNILGSTLARLVLIAWLAVRVEAGHRRHLVEWTTNLRHLDSAEFEWFVGEVFRREGWKVRETGRRYEADGNIDLELSRNGERVVVQCNRWTAKSVGVDDIRGFAGTLLREGLAGSAGVFVTLSDFTPQALTEAKDAGLALVNGRQLFARIEKVRQLKPCPECRMPMRLDRSQRGWWLRCAVAGCHGKRDLHRDPALAVALLMQTAR